MIQEREYRERGITDLGRDSFNLIRDALKARYGGRAQKVTDEHLFRLPTLDATNLAKAIMEVEKPPPLTDESIDYWKHLPAYTVPYTAGEYTDGTRYEAGEYLIIGKDQVMASFEKDWCEAVSNSTFNGRRGKTVAVEVGFGMGILADLNIKKMLKVGGVYHIIELNDQVYANLENWKIKKEIEIANAVVEDLKNNKPVEIRIYNGEVGKVLQEHFDLGSINLLFSDTYPIQEGHEEINDLIYLDTAIPRLTRNGRLSFCGFKRGNQTEYLTARQLALVYPHFRKTEIKNVVELTPPLECEYMNGPKALVPVIVCSMPVQSV